MRKRKIVHGTAAPLRKSAHIEMSCSQCGRIELVDSQCISVICSVCVQKMCPVDPKLLAPRQPVDPNSTKPRGWKFMKEFVDNDGTVYHSGVEQPKLKGTLKPTDVAKIKASQKEKSKEKKKHRGENELKKLDKLAKEYKKKKKLKKKDEEMKLSDKFLE